MTLRPQSRGIPLTSSRPSRFPFADSDDASTSLPGSCRPTDSHARRGRFTVNAVIGTREHFKAVALQRGSHYAVRFTGKPPYSIPPYSPT